ncbi:hypothetical protein NW070_02525 [Mycoplasmopsis cynos]|nr:hypothetical protein [Mycoplasmopsis cynos]UWV77943.1 hypothetical protein NW070_02525 [Mycoplasmopsis cynos]
MRNNKKGQKFIGCASFLNVNIQRAMKSNKRTIKINNNCNKRTFRLI